MLTLGSDWATCVRLEKTIGSLQTLQRQKEKNLSTPLGTFKKQPDEIEPTLLNPTHASFTLTNVCETSNLWLEKIQLAKPHAKAQDKFEISLELQGDYKNFTTLITSLTQLPWVIDWKTLRAIEGKNLNYPLKIKIKLNINRYYLDQRPSKPAFQTKPQNEKIIYSPFSISRHAGQIMTNNQTTDLIIRDPTQTILRARKPMLN